MKIVVLSQNNAEMQIPSLGLGMNTGIESALRSLGCVFGLSAGVGGGGLTSQTLVQAAQDNLSEAMTRFESSLGLTGGYDWINLNVEGEPVSENLIRGSSSAVVPTSHPYFNRANDTSTAEGTGRVHRQLVNQLAAYGYPTADGQVTYAMLHDSIVRANQDLLSWIKADSRVTGCKVSCWTKFDGKPIPGVGNGWFNNPWDGTYNVSTIYGSAASGMRTIQGDNLWKILNGNLVEASETWSSGLGSYPVGSNEARGHARMFESVDNCLPLAKGFDACPSQNYNPIYPAGRPLTSISPLGYATASAPTDLTLGWVGGGDRFVRRTPAIESLSQAQRLGWLAAWSRLGTRAAMGCEMSMDLGGFANNPFNGLGTEVDDWEDCYIDPVLAPVTAAEVAQYALPAYMEGLVLVPSRWFFWTAEGFFLRQLFTGSGVGLLDADPLARSRSNIEWRFAGSYGGSPDWSSGSAWHQHVAAKMDEFSVERIGRLRSRITQAARANAARQSTLASLVGG